MKLFVIGGTGLVGNKLLEYAEGRFELCSTYHSHKMRRPDSYKLDITEKDEMRELMKDLAPGAVINTAAFHNVDRCETDMDLAKAINVDAAVNVAEVCAEIGAHHLYLSTEYVFDGTKGTPYTEEDETNPLGYYGETKRMAEKAILRGKGDNLVARTSVIYGWNDTKLNFATWVLGELEKKHPVRIVSDQVGSPTLADSLAEALLKAVEMRKTGLYHIAGGEAVDRYNFTLTLAGVFGLDAALVKPVKTSELEQKARRPPHAPLDVSKAEKELGIRMMTTKEGLERMRSQRGF